MKYSFGPGKFLLALGMVLLMGGCSTKQVPPPKVPETALATEGPPLVLVGEYAGMRLEGYMDRSCMTGYGSIGIRSIGYSRQGDLAVDVPAMPEDPELAAAMALRPGGAAAPLALATYPATGKKRRAATSAASTASDRSRQNASVGSSGLRLASYPTESEEQYDDDYAVLTSRQEGRREQTNLRIPRAQTASWIEVAVSVPGGTEFACNGNVDAPPTYKGRIRGLLQCTGGRQILFSLRNLGPDQGVGIGKETEDSGLMILFYHVSLDEAWRRFPAVKEDIRYAQGNK